MDTNSVAFADWLAGTLASRGISQAELARRAGISRATINGILSGRRKPGRRVLCALADGLPIDLHELLLVAGLETDTAEPIEIAEWVGLYESADESTRTEMLDWARIWTERSRKLRVGEPES